MAVRKKHLVGTRGLFWERARADLSAVRRDG